MNTATTPLTEDQRALAARYLPLAEKHARICWSKWFSHRDDFRSAAWKGLCEAARAFDPDRGVQFSTFARWRIRGSLQEAKREILARGFTHARSDAPEVLGLSMVHEELGQVTLTRPDDPAGADDERVELLDSWLARLPARHARVIRLVEMEGRTHDEAARDVGVSKSRVSYLRVEALEMLRDVARAWHARAR